MSDNDDFLSAIDGDGELLATVEEQARQYSGLKGQLAQAEKDRTEMLELLRVVQKDLEDDGRWPRWRDGLEALLARFPR